MPFSENWVEGDPDGSIITVSELDNWIRRTKVAIRERLEDSLFEVGSWAGGPLIRQGATRHHLTFEANLNSITGVPGTFAWTQDTKRLYHTAITGSPEEMMYLGKLPHVTVGIPRVPVGSVGLRFTNSDASATLLSIYGAGQIATTTADVSALPFGSVVLAQGASYFINTIANGLVKAVGYDETGFGAVDTSERLLKIRIEPFAPGVPNAPAGTITIDGSSGYLVWYANGQRRFIAGTAF